MLTHSERVPVCSPQLVPSAAISEKCKVGEIKDEQKTCEADASNASVNQSPQSKMFPDSSPDNQDIEREYPSPTRKSESKKYVDQSGSTSVVPETLDTKIPDHLPVAFASPKSAIPTGQKGDTDSVPETLDTKIPDQLPVAFVSPKSALPTDEKGATDSVPNLEKADLTGEDSHTQKECYSKPILATREKSVVVPACAEPIDVSNAPELVSDPPTEEMGGTDSVPNLEKKYLSGEDSNTQKKGHSEIALITREKSVADPASCSEMIVTADVLKSLSDLEKGDSKCQDYNIQKELHNEYIVSSEKKLADPASCAELIDVSHVPERDSKGEDSNTPKEQYSEAALVTSEKMVVEPTSCSQSIDVSDVLQSASNLERRDLKDENSIIQKELFSESTLVSSEKMVVDPAPCAESIDVSDVLESVFNLQRTGLESEHSNIQKKLHEESIIVTRENVAIDPASRADSVHVPGVLESVPNLEKTYLEGEGSDNQKELHKGSTLVTRESMAVDPVPCGVSVDVPDALESLIEQNRGTLCMDAIAAIEEFMTTSAEEDQPQCSSPIALSPWGESGYYQGDAVDSALWGVQDDPINDMWSLLSPTPAPQHLSGAKSGGEGVHVNNAGNVTQGEIDFFQRGQTGVHGIDAGTITQGEIDFLQRSPTPGGYWGLTEQVKAEATAVPVSSIDLNTGLFGWQPSASERPNTGGGPWSTSQNPNLYYSYEATAPSVRTSHEASVTREFTDFGAANMGEAVGNNTKSWNTSAGNANRGSQRRDRYSQISESWLLSSNNSRSRPDGVSSGGTSRTAPRGTCKFHESGYCRKGSSCNNLHR
uniref:Uncharacterized protein n=1 Tax=Avena sativa TaxID=4498 RepID=A0ACD5WGM5_AVESA